MFYQLENQASPAVINITESCLSTIVFLIHLSTKFLNVVLFILRHETLENPLNMAVRAAASLFDESLCSSIVSLFVNKYQVISSALSRAPL